MGYIKEPEKVDFYIKSRPLTDKDKAVFAKFIKKNQKELAKQKKLS